MARSFNGTTDEINLGNISSVTGSNARTIAGWIYPTTSLSAADLFAYGANTTDLGCRFTMGNTSTNDIALGFVADNVHSTTTPLTSNTWQHVAATFNGGITNTTNILLYYNGAAQATAGGNGTTINTTNASFGIGFNAFLSGSFLTGNLADVAIWNIALTAAEVAALAKGVRPHNIRSGSLQGWWPLDGLQSPEPDLSGNANNGTLTGTAKVFGPPLMQFTPRWQFVLPFDLPIFTLMPQIVT